MSAADSTELDTGRLRDFLAENGIKVEGAPLTWQLLSGGRSNLTYLLDLGGQGLVLRRPPLGQHDPRAHDVGREYRILRALHPAGVPVPEALACAPGSEVIGVPFYIMRRVPGRVIESAAAAPDLLSATSLDALVDAVVDGLVGLHRVDFQQVGLGDLGRPAGFAARQVKRWTEHWETRRQRAIPALDELGQRLRAAVASGLPLDDEPPTIVHGDYNIGNLMLSGAGEPPALRAILDWEMATIGHPLLDLGLLLTYNGPHMNAVFEVSDAIACRPDFPPPREIAARYAARSGRSLALLDFFYVLAFFKVLVLIEDVRARHQAGTTRGEGYSGLGQSSPRLAEALLAEADASALPGLRGRGH